MATDLPISFRASPLPSNFRGTPQQFLDAIVARLSIATEEQLALFVTGSTPPTSDSGPWIKDGITWYVWDTGTGAYIPQVIEFESLRYIASASDPDPNTYVFNILLNGGGKATAIKYYSGGAWHDVYEDKFAEYDAKFKAYPFRAYKSAATQIITAGAGDAQVVYDVESFDPDNVFASNQFTAPTNGYYSIRAGMSLGLDSGTPTGIDLQIKLRVNGSSLITRSPGQSTDNTGGAVFAVADIVYLTAGQTVDAVASATTTGASTWVIYNDVIATFFEAHRVQKA